MNTHKKKGFTLVELLVVVAIIGIVASMLLPVVVKMFRRSPPAQTTYVERERRAEDSASRPRFDATKPEVYNKLTSALNAMEVLDQELSNPNSTTYNLYKQSGQLEKVRAMLKQASDSSRDLRRAVGEVQGQ